MMLMLLGFLVVVAPSSTALRCLDGYDVITSSSPLLPVTSYSTLKQCTASDPACVRVTGSGSLLGISASGAAYQCAERLSCISLSQNCVQTANTIINSPLTLPIVNCQLSCCFTDNCNSQPISGDSATTILPTSGDNKTTILPTSGDNKTTILPIGGGSETVILRSEVVLLAELFIIMLWGTPAGFI